MKPKLKSACCRPTSSVRNVVFGTLLLLINITSASRQENGECKYSKGCSAYNCHHLRDSFNRLLNITKKPEVKFWILTLKVKEEENTPSFLAVNYEIRQATYLEVQKKRVKEEICALKASGSVCDDMMHTLIKFTNSGTGRLNISDDTYLSINHHNKAAHYMLVAFRPERKWVSIAPNVKNDFYNNYLVDQNTNILLISTVDTAGERVNESVHFSIGTNGEDSVLKTLPTNVLLLKLKRKCMYFDPDVLTWTDEKCVTLSTTANSTTCECDHNSAFASVFLMRNITIPPEINTTSTILEITSIVLLLITVIMLVIFRQRLRNFDRVLVQISLCTALLLEHLFFVIAPLGVETKWLCETFAILTHYFLTVTCVLMVMEGSVMLIKVLAPHTFTDNNHKKLHRFLGFGFAWIIPLLYAVTWGAIGIKNQNYLLRFEERERYEKCWISYDYLLIVIVPVAIALLVNICIAVRLGALVWRMSQNAEQYKPTHLRDQSPALHARNSLRAVFILLPILGLPWSIGFLVNIKGLEVFFMAIHVVINGLQGLFLFFHYVVFNKDMRKVVKRTWITSTANATSVPTVNFVSNNTSSNKIVE